MEKLDPLFSVGLLLFSVVFILNIDFFFRSLSQAFKIFPSSVSFCKSDWVILYKVAIFASEDIQFLSLKRKTQSSALVPHLVQSGDSTYFCFSLKPCFSM